MIYVITIGVIAAVMLGMAVGVMFAGKVLRGSCGGVGTKCDCSTAKRAECTNKSS